MPRKVLTSICVLVGLAWLGPLDTAWAQRAAQPVTLRVLLPEDDAELTIEGRPTKQTGTSRRFVSPALEPGVNYTYTLVAFWEPNNYTKITRTRTVAVRAGQELEVDMRPFDAKNPDKVVIRFVPTPDDVVAAMCKLGRVGKDDVVYDLGCGDGRMVIHAVKHFGAKRGIGVDLDPERIKESKANTRKAGVEDKVEIRQGDVLNIADLADASVVLLYMGDEMNERLRPVLRKTLKPGSRIVSHRFLMGDWKPHKSITITGNDGDEYELHLWEIGKEPGAKP